MLQIHTRLKRRLILSFSVFISAALLLTTFGAVFSVDPPKLMAEETLRPWANAALNSLSDSNPNTADAAKIADGYVNGAVGNPNSRIYLSASQAKEAWFEFSFAEEKSIQKAAVFSGYDATGKTTELLSDFSFYYWSEDSWIPIPGGSVSGSQEQVKQVVFTSPVTTEKIKLVNDGGEAAVRLREIALFELRDMKNLASHALLSASSFDDSAKTSMDTRRYPVFVNDGGTDFGEYYWAPKKSNSGTEYLEFTWAGEEEFNTIDIFSGNESGEHCISDVSLAYKAGEEWITLEDDGWKNLEGGSNRIQTSENITASALRISFLRDDNTRLEIREIEIFKEEEEEPEDTTATSSSTSEEPDEPDPPEEGFDLLQDQRPKRVYADYHGPRYTRAHDGALGNWAYSGTAAKSHASQTYFSYQPDLLDENNREDLASSSYPLVGMQSQLDDDYMEYQILSAKAAHIDGFFVEWGFREHSSNTQLQKLQVLAEKYDFEIGVNWCDSWLFSWLGKYRPELSTRQDYIDAFAGEVQYLYDNVFTHSTGVNYGGHPVLFLFGGGIQAEEYAGIKDAIAEQFTDENRPYFYRRAPLNASLSGETAEYYFSDTAWHKAGGGKAPLMEGYFPWIPYRARNAADYGFDNFDKYATQEDLTAALEALQLKFENDPYLLLRSSVVTPGMDNRGCAGWGTDLSYIPRNGGDSYEAMWSNQVNTRDKVDLVYIASWNDYNEGHQIEPTVEDGYTALNTTRAYAAQFKGETANPESALELPFELFTARKNLARLRKYACPFTDPDVLEQKLDSAAYAIAGQDFSQAEAELDDVKSVLASWEAASETEEIHAAEENNLLTAFAPEKPNQPPTVEWLLPEQDADLVPDVRFAVQAKVTDPDGEIVSCKVSVNDKILDNTGTYTAEDAGFRAEVKINEPGTYILKIHAEDDAGAETISTERKIRVGYPLKNVAVGQSYQASSEVADSPGSYALDGITDDNDKRWRSTQSDPVHYLEVSLEEPAEVVAVEYYTGYTPNAWAVHHMKLQYWDGTDWQNVAGTEMSNNKELYRRLWAESPVTAQKFRFCSEDGSRGVRVRELCLMTYDKTPQEDSDPVFADMEPVVKPVPQPGIYDAANDIAFRLDKEAASKFRERSGSAYLSFSARSASGGTLEIWGDTEDKGDFAVVADISVDDSGEWQTYKVPVSDVNAAFLRTALGESDLLFRGPVQIKDVHLDFTAYVCKDEEAETTTGTTTAEGTETSETKDEPGASETTMSGVTEAESSQSPDETSASDKTVNVSEKPEEGTGDAGKTGAAAEPGRTAAAVILIAAVCLTVVKELSKKKNKFN